MAPVLADVGGPEATLVRGRKPCSRLDEGLFCLRFRRFSHRSAPTVSIPVSHLDRSRSSLSYSLRTRRLPHPNSRLRPRNANPGDGPGRGRGPGVSGSIRQATSRPLFARLLSNPTGHTRSPPSVITASSASDLTSNTKLFTTIIRCRPHSISCTMQVSIFCFDTRRN